MSFGEYIKKTRLEKKLGVNELAKLSGLSNAQISRLETGKNKQPRTDTIEKLAAALNVPSDIMLKKAGLLKTTSPQFDAMLRDALDPRFYEYDIEYENHLYHLFKNFSDLEADEFKVSYIARFWLLSHIYGFHLPYPKPKKFIEEALKLSPRDRMKLSLDIGQGDFDYNLDISDFLILPNLTYKGEPLSPTDITKILDMLRILFDSKEV